MPGAASYLKKGIVPDAGDMRAIERIIRGYAPTRAVYVQQNVQRAFSQFYRANKVVSVSLRGKRWHHAPRRLLPRAASNAARAGLARTLASSGASWWRRPSVALLAVAAPG